MQKLATCAVGLALSVSIVLAASVADAQTRTTGEIFGRVTDQETSIAADYIDANGDGELTVDEQIPEGTVPISGSTVHYHVIGTNLTAVRAGTKSQFQDEWVLGAEYEVLPRLNLGVRWIHRAIARVLEDVQLTPNEMIVTSGDVYGGVPTFTEFVIANPGTGLNATCPPEHPGCWVNPNRQYDALELTVEKRLSDRWQVLGSYRISRLFGNYQGLYRSDNGQSAPNIASLFDFPNNTTYTQAELDALCDNLYDPIGSPTDNTACKNRERMALLPGEMAGQGSSGLLNTDRTHVIQVVGSYTAPFGVTFGAATRFESGTPITALRAHPNPFYGNPGELPEGARGDEGRTPFGVTLDLHADYAFRLSRRRDIRGVLVVDMFNVFNTQRETAVDQRSDFSPGNPNPNFGAPLAFAPPRTIRFGVKVQF